MPSCLRCQVALATGEDEKAQQREEGAHGAVQWPELGAGRLAQLNVDATAAAHPVFGERILRWANSLNAALKEVPPQCGALGASLSSTFGPAEVRMDHPHRMLPCARCHNLIPLCSRCDCSQIYCGRTGR